MTNIDLTEDPASDSQVRGWYKKLMVEVNSIDEQLDAASDTSGKRKFTNELVAAQESEWKPAVESLGTQMSAMTEDQRAGVFYGMLREFHQDLQG